MLNILNNILIVEITMFPVILGGIANMIFTKTNTYKKLAKPIDNGLKLWDGNELFGSHKTWIGALSMIFLCTLFQVIWGWVCRSFSITLNQSCLHYKWSIGLDVLIGCLLGITYIIFELPNSFIKRRLNISAGETASQTGWKQCVFTIVDQFDSMFGISLIPVIFSGAGILTYINFVIIGGLTHLIINVLLKMVRIRRSI